MLVHTTLPSQNLAALEKYQFIHHFVPHAVLQTRARLLSNAALVAYIGLILVVFALFRILPLFFPGVLGYASNINIVDLLTDTNEMREKQGLEPLRLNPQLTKAANLKAQHMFKNNYWAHIAPDGTDPWTFILSQDYDYTYAGENLAKNFNSSDQVVDAWMKSTSHRQNLLNGNYDEIGFAVVNGVLDGYETTLVVQLFGTPKVLSAVVSKEEEGALLAALAPANPQEAPQPALIPSPQQVLPAVDVSIASKSIGILFGSFVLALFALDVWYSKKKGILKFTGHTVAHIAILLFAILGVLFVLSPGTIL
ncbi:MAG: hypothetical protein UT92_C0008G0008 [Candidatus Curtissbacteria bacterium GW2011_GWA1_40_24]|uniref:SCP domain-containing protein n=2 Tax=Patescibacteria group TaxID=1783273 RepID=A0A0G0U6M3_9BACT|nr:MAG: hypothetical protein UT92_C0008G0008 [Candidatus Curtissbacteria bacterium GW2011_GWA1_40_24]KKR88282.1 MAG: hypothetical protein UU38_C0011G0008 [Candidatus Wolfebacteria bacterium GW2011_GWB1_41_12]